MNLKPILSREDYVYLKVISSNAGRYPLDRESLQILRQKLESALVLDPEAIPEDVVTMHSRVHLLDRNDDSLKIWTLVYPGDSSTSGGKLSVLAPLGLAILGCQVGDRVEWPIPAGWARITIVKITYQPEAKLRRAALRA
jgi:regulator of nucleoside diphosphate kinase